MLITSSNNGVSWTLVASGIDETLLNLSYGNGTFAASGNAGTIAISTDAGASWAIQSSGTSANLTSII